MSLYYFNNYNHIDIEYCPHNYFRRSTNYSINIPHDSINNYSNKRNYNNFIVTINIDSIPLLTDYLKKYLKKAILDIKEKTQDVFYEQEKFKQNKIQIKAQNNSYKTAIKNNKNINLRENYNYKQQNRKICNRKR